jgi:PKHD-type hydroxylase
MISNDPYKKRRITYSSVWYDGAFSDEEIQKIEYYCSQDELKPSMTVGDGVNCEFIRKSKLNFYNKNKSNSWIFDKFNYVIESLNNDYYNFDLYGYDIFQYTVYNSTDKGEYNWHIDTILDELTEGPERSTRKLSIIMLLSVPGKDFTGGEFQIMKDLNPITIDMHKGKIVAFPSFMMHRVKPILTGIRKSIVIWVEGPKFR